MKRNRGRYRINQVKSVYKEAAVVGLWRNGADNYQIAGALSLTVKAIEIIISEYKMIWEWGNLLGAKT